MTREELRGLIGGYSTGSLSEAERKTLFEAALEDQDLFDELAQEQALKVALEEPGAKQRLLAALEPKVVPKPWWKMTWAWAAAAAACAVVIAGVVLERSTVRVEEVARLQAPETAAPAVPQPAPEVAPSTLAQKAAAPAPTTAAPVPKAAAPLRQSAPLPTKVAEPAATPAAAPPAPTAAPVGVAPGPVAGTGPLPPQELKKEAAEALAQTDSVAAIAPQQLAAAPPVVAPGAQAFAPGTIGGVGGGARRLSQAPAPAAKAPRFAFDYSVTPQLVLRVLPYANAFLTVTVTRPSGQEQLASSKPVQAGMQTEVQLPTDATSVTVLFSAQAGRTGGGVVRNDPLSGTKSDPNPSPDSLLVALIPLPR